MHCYTPLPRKTLAAALFGLLASNAALADNYTWSVPTIGDAQNGLGISNDTPSSFAGVNNAGTIVGNFEYDNSVSNINGLINGNFYGFAGASLVKADQTGAGASTGLFISTNPNFIALNEQQNGVSAINNNGYIIFNPNTGGTNDLSYIGNSTAGTAGSTTVPAGDFVFNDANTYAGGDTHTLDSGGHIVAGSSVALGLDSSGTSYGVVVGTAAAIYGTPESNNGGQVGVLYNNTGATLDGIANGTYGDFNYGGQTALSANSSNQTDTIFTGVAEHGGDVYVTGYWYNPANNQNNDGLIFNVTTNTWTDVNNPNAVNGTYVTGLNSQGEAVGYYLDANSVAHGFTYNYVTNTFINATIDYPGQDAHGGTVSGGLGNGTFLFGVNDSGTLVGQASTTNYANGFGIEGVVTSAAVPLPSAFWLMLSSLAAGHGLLRRKQRAA
jgi:hypothetical protein